MESIDATRLDAAVPAYLIIQRGAALLETVELPPAGRVTIGRAHSNRVVLPDAKCSRQHCEVYFRNGGWHLRDLNSRNGVLLHGIRVEGDQQLEIGDTIAIGACILRFTDQRQPGEPRRAEAPVEKTAESAFEIIERKSGTQYDRPSGVQRTQQHADHATALFRIARTMAACQNEQELCRVVLEGLTQRCGASLGGILLVPEGEDDPDLEALVPCAVVGDRPVSEFSTFLTRVALDDQDAILAHDISRHASLAAQVSLYELKAESAICSPIRHAKKVLGVIHLYSVRGGVSMSQADLEFVLAVADQLGDQLFAIRERANLEVGLDRARRHVTDLQGQLGVETALVGASPRLEDLRRTIARIAPTDALVLIRGESGVGKELVARAVHFNSLRKDGPFVCVNCAALTESLLESELFGHEKGAFTGASARRAGKFEQAHGGTLFLDEIGEMSPEIQAKFLRVLEGQAFERVGGGEPISVDVRVVTATNRDLEEAVREKRLRRDLFFRLQVIEVTVAPLRQHPEDIPSIAHHFLMRFAAQAHRRVRGFSQPALQKLQAHNWPGNVRELRNVVERAVILSEHEYLGPDDVVLTKLNLDLEDVIREASAPIKVTTDPGMDTQVDPGVDLWGSFIQKNTTLDDMDRLYIEAVLRSTYWNKSKASRILQIERTTLDRRLKKYGLSRPGGSSADDDEEFTDDGTPDTLV
ncbi:sigma 54-interacting transcriptional regulator [Planctomicrobium piriforme]|uniref:Nif-specific regulatory protein n=1 Tax=Planctomicrobium piriforme TaxID=1576369 RepID=A0A1I3HY15_9PLAN|nr:sigma 54-interacting transcriptional regulator [Planctomicrobium piriforme]SFI40532.1 Nif-specific regulatory protein [Planctomicrobium piriforme]